MAALNQEFSDRLLSLINGKGLNPHRFAGEIGVSSGVMHKYCKKGGVPEWDILLSIAKYFEVTVDWLLTGEPSNHDQTSPETTKFLKQTKAILESKNKPLADTLANSIETFYEAIRPAKEQPDAKITAGEAFDIVAKELVFVCSNPKCGKEVGSFTEPDKLSDVCPFCGEVTNAKTYAEQISALGIGLKESNDSEDVSRKAKA